MAPHIAVNAAAMKMTKKKLTWMPGRLWVMSETTMWTFFVSKKPDINQPDTNAPIAKNATYPRSSRPAKPTTMLSPRAIITYASVWMTDS